MPHMLTILLGSLFSYLSAVKVHLHKRDGVLKVSLNNKAVMELRTSDDVSVSKTTVSETRMRADSYKVEARRVVDISPNHVNASANYEPVGLWEGYFEAGIWLRLPQGSPEILQLALRYTDQAGEVSIPVDAFRPSTFSCALLNGCLRLAVNGRIRNMGLYLVGAPKDIAVNVEQWHLTPQRMRTLAQA